MNYIVTGSCDHKDKNANNFWYVRVCFLDKCKCDVAMQILSLSDIFLHNSVKKQKHHDITRTLDMRLTQSVMFELQNYM